MLDAAQTLREKLVVRYFMLNGLAPTELSLARLEGLDPVNCTLFLPKRHWKKNCLTDIDVETVRLQIIYAGNRAEGPLIRGRADKRRAKDGGLHYNWLNHIVHVVANRTLIAGKERVSPIVLKRTFARIWLRSGNKKNGGNVCTLQKQFGHKHLWSTAHYLRFFMDDVKEDHLHMLERFNNDYPIEMKRCPTCGQPILPKIQQEVRT